MLGMELGENKSDTNNEVVGDIEQNIITNSHPNINSAHLDDVPLAGNGDGNGNEDGDEDEGDEDEDLAAAPAPPPSVGWLIILSKKLGWFVITPLVVPIMMIYVVWGGTKSFSDGGEDRYEGSLYSKVQLYKPMKIKMKQLSATVACRVGCVLLIWLLISTLALHKPLKTATFLGVIHWKWTILATFFVLSYPFISLTLTLYGQNVVNPKSKGYYYEYILYGLRESLVSLLHVTSVFLLWILYFHAHAGLHPGVDKYATRTLVSLLVAAFLWLLKAALLLRWEQRAVYEKFRPKILMSAFRLWILCRVFDGAARSTYYLLPSRSQRTNAGLQVRGYRHSPFFVKRNARDYIVSSTYVSLYQMQQAADCLTILSNTSTSTSIDDAHQLSDVFEAYQQKLANSFSDPNEATTEAKITHFLKGNKLFKDVLQAEYPSKDLNQIPFDKWVVDAHKSCLSVAYTLSDAFAMVNVLDTILTSCLILAVIVVWLLVTQLATTTVLVVIASPFLALSFVFGDVCKTFFQGFIFAFITHPFNIGDRCLIDKIEVEVKRVNIMTTTFMKIGTNEQMLYPNSNLATMLIINLGDKLDPDDVIELILDPSTKSSDILDMQEHIEKFIDLVEQRVLFDKERNVVIKEIKNGISIIVGFQHAMDGKDISYSQFLEKKVRQRSMLFIEIKKFLENLGVEVVTS